MKLVSSLSYNLLFVLVDIVVSTVLYIHGNHLITFAEDIWNFDILRSTLDLWGMLLVRVSLLLGASIGVYKNQEDGPQRMRDLGTLNSLLCLVVMAYALAKLLMFSEQDGMMYEPWFLSLLIWTCVAAMGTVMMWRILSKTPRAETGEDIERLLDQAAGNSSEEEEEEECRGAKALKKGQATPGATVGRLLSYCRKDAGLLGVGLFFLLVSAVCESGLPPQLPCLCPKK